MNQAKPCPPGNVTAASSRPIIAGLWIGGRLPIMQRLSIQSFLTHGHPYHLYAYEEIDNLPPGTTLQDARQVLPREKIFRYSAAAGPGRGSYAGFANLFRYQLLLQKGGYWVDTDMVCVKPFCFSQDLVIPSERNPDGTLRPTCCVLKSPPGGALVEACLQACFEKQPEQLGWGETGPFLVEELVRRLQLVSFVHPPDTFCPIDWFGFPLLVAAGIQLPKKTHSVHLWNEMWRRHGLDPSANYQPDCLYEQFKAQYLSPAGAAGPDA